MHRTVVGQVRAHLKVCSGQSMAWHPISCWSSLLMVGTDSSLVTGKSAGQYAVWKHILTIISMGCVTGWRSKRVVQVCLAQW